MRGVVCGTCDFDLEVWDRDLIQLLPCVRPPILMHLAIELRKKLHRTHTFDRIIGNFNLTGTGRCIELSNIERVIIHHHRLPIQQITDHWPDLCKRWSRGYLLLRNPMFLEGPFTYQHRRVNIPAAQNVPKLVTHSPLNDLIFTLQAGRFGIKCHKAVIPQFTSTIQHTLPRCCQNTHLTHPLRLPESVEAFCTPHTVLV